MNAEHTGQGTQAGPPLLRLHLFGGFRVTRDGGPPLADKWPRPSARALVKLLAVSPGHSLHREQAMEICWPDSDNQAALGSLRVALHAARRAIEPELAPRASSSYLTGEGTLLRLDPHTVVIDADQAENLAERALASGSAEALTAALAAFTGELLPEDRYAPWAEARREELSAMCDRVRLALAEAHLADGETELATEVALRAVAAAPAEERAHRVLIDAYLHQGLRRQAVRQYHLCREALDAELGVRPGPATERLHLLALDASTAVIPAASVPVLPAAIRTPPGPPLRGRSDELGVLLAADGPPVRLVGGEAGVGKTRLTAEAARRAAEAGTTVLWGAGHDAEGHTPYGVFVEALDAWLADRPSAERAGIGGEYPELASLLPTLGQIGAGAERSPEEQRDRLFRATAGLLGDLAAAGPVLLVLDDLHAADTGSYQLLSHLARRASATGAAWRFVVTYRAEEFDGTDPRRTALEALSRQGLARSMELGRLGREECLAVAEDAGARTGLDRVWELSLGNPLFALELARSAQDGADTAGLSAPEGVRQLVTARLARLGSAARRVVEAISVAGGGAALGEILDVAEHGLHPPLSSAEATDAVDAAVAASVVAERPVVVGGRPLPGLAFRHPLVRLTCYDGLSAARRRQLHSAYAEAVLRRRPDAVDTLASHLTRADDPRATQYLRQAAERAAALCANDTADRYYAELTARLDAMAADAAQARIDRGAVLRRMARYQEAATVLREALADMVRRGDEDGQVLAAARLTEVLAKHRGTDEGEELLRTYPPGPHTPPPTTATHHLAAAVVRFVGGRYEAAHASAQRAQKAAEAVRGSERRGLLARSLGSQATALGLAGRFAQARAAADLALPHAEAYGDQELLVTILSVLREHARRSGRLGEAVSIGRQALSLAEHTGDPTTVAFERANLAELHLLLREFAEAREQAEAAVRDGEPSPAWCTPYALAALARVRIRTGEPGAAELLAQAGRTAEAQRDRQAVHEVRTADAERLVREGRPQEALTLLADDSDPSAAPLLAWAELLSGHPERAARRAAAETLRAARVGERLSETGSRTVHAAALAALGRERAAHEEFERAATLARELPYPAGAFTVDEAAGTDWTARSAPPD
ncbi:AAA family ATPase [Streptomyces sp. NBC_01762]|uniref:ATP-binding protein n=1 Tax=unclassified Streptomyces TaxID=2593676 RepID=UPI002DDA21A9|nr:MULTISPECIES: AAA family ATPase [unclassified Streptomyces]WSC44199.1 AAA family ATPase [Streptomyces sp. NBC_01762]WSC56851.1 AAA family ATPase [Streptomyces sp. NBC_01761]WSD23786.1 AAA family ATPase [Streptomyces sp. NBC_01751]WSJ54197.1 AAA family ATPase [Streptomyces sp. NBC_01318]